MIYIRTLSLFSLAAMVASIALAISSGDFTAEGAAIWSLPWGKVTLIDLYIGFVFFGSWIAFREDSILRTVAWWVGLALLGNLVAALYLVVVCFSSSDLRELFTGEEQ